jgi:hypothetical protein
MLHLAQLLRGCQGGATAPVADWRNTGKDGCKVRARPRSDCSAALISDCHGWPPASPHADRVHRAVEYEIVCYQHAQRVGVLWSLCPVKGASCAAPVVAGPQHAGLRGHSEPLWAPMGGLQLYVGSCDACSRGVSCRS